MCVLQDGWNKFDVFLVVTAIIDLIITTAQMNFIRVLRVLRTQKLLRFFRIAQNGRMGKAAQVRACLGFPIRICSSETSATCALDSTLSSA